MSVFFIHIYIFCIVNNLHIYTFTQYCNIRYVFFILCGNKDYYIYIYKTIISGGKQKKKLLIRKKTVEFVYSLKTKRWFNSHAKCTVRVSSSFKSLLIAERTSTAAGTKCRSQVTSAGYSTGHHATLVNKQHLKCLLALITIWNLCNLWATSWTNAFGKIRIFAIFLSICNITKVNYVAYFAAKQTMSRKYFNFLTRIMH